MTQNEFFNIIIDGLRSFPESQIQKIIQYYRLQFKKGLSYGETESEIIISLGDPYDIVEKIKSNDINLNLFNDIENISPENKKSNQYVTFSYNSSKNIESSEKQHFKNRDKSSSNTVNIILKICIIILAIIIFFPLATSIIGILIGAFGIIISIFLASIGILIGCSFNNFLDTSSLPLFVSNFPHPSLVLFSLSSLTSSLLIFFIIYYILKFIFRLLKSLYKQIKGGIL